MVERESQVLLAGLSSGVVDAVNGQVKHITVTVTIL